MGPRQYVAYYRVSTPRQGHSGLGLEAQRESVRRHVERASGELVAEFTDVKSGTNSRRQQLAEAIRTCRMRRAILVIARLDRLFRNVAMIADLIESELEFVAVDFPAASRLALHVLAAIAEYEAKLASERIKAALAAAKARGVKLGGTRGFANLPAAVAASVEARKERAVAIAMDVAPIIWKLLARGRTNSQIADELNLQMIPTPQGVRWNDQGVRRVTRLTERQFPLFAEAAAAAPDWRTARWQERAQALAPLIWGLRREGLSYDSIAEELDRRGTPTARDGKWSDSTVFRMARATKSLTPDAERFRTAGMRRRVLRAQRRALDLAPLVMELRGQGKSLSMIAQEFNERGIPSARGGRWWPSGVRKVLDFATDGSRLGSPSRRTVFRVPPLDRKARATGGEAAERIWEFKARGESTAIADKLNRLKIKPPKCGRWHPETVDRVICMTADRFPRHAKAAAKAPNPWMAYAYERVTQLAPIVREVRATRTLSAAAAELTRRGVPTPRGCRQWWPTTVSKVLRRADEAATHASRS